MRGKWERSFVHVLKLFKKLRGVNIIQQVAKTYGTLRDEFVTCPNPSR